MLGLQLLSLRAGHDWGDDFAQYVLHARNLVEGRPYAETGYVFNPGFARLGPPTYPPLIPLLLALPYALHGLDLEAMKRFLLLPFAAFLVCFHLAARRRIGAPASLGLLLLLGTNPYLWQLKDQVLSDLPFLAFLWLVFALCAAAEPVPGRAPPAAARLGWPLAIGVAVYLAYGARALGITLLPALVLYDLLRLRRLGRGTLVACAVAAALVVAQNLALATLEGYGDAVGGRLTEDLPFGPLRNLARNAVGFPAILAGTWRGGLPLPLERAGALALLALGVLGGLLSLVRRPALYDVFAPVYAGTFALFPFAGARRLTPLLPVLLLWIYRGCREAPRLGPRARSALTAGAFGFLALSQAAFYARADFGPLPEGVHTAAAQELFAAVRETVPEDGVCLFWKPRALALFSDRRAAAPHEFGTPEEIAAFRRAIGARCVIERKQAPEDDPLRRFVALHGSELEPRFANAEFVLYELKPEPR